MAFELTKSLIDDIIFSMEDQNAEFVFDAESACLVPLDSLDESESENLEENDNIYPLPDWSSDDGFEIMEKFAESVRIPKIQHELQQVLSNGRGVFRNFKNVLKMYPEVERRWFLFKNDRMKRRVIEWYNSLRESWGLEKLEEEYTDVSQETDELLLDDFVFSEYASKDDASDLESGLETLVDGDSELDAGQLFLLKHHSNISEQDKKSGFVCRSQSGDFAGCLLISNCPPDSRETVIITDFFVVENYRGLGIGKMLLTKSLASLTDRGIRFCFASGMLVPETFRLTFEQYGFKKNGPGFILCISEKI